MENSERRCFVFVCLLTLTCIFVAVNQINQQREADADLVFAFVKTSNSTEKNTLKAETTRTVKSKDKPTVTSSVETDYDPTTELSKRRENLKKWCKSQRKLNLSYITKYVSRYGTSLSGVDFWTCFTPKCASQSFTAALLHATGYLTANSTFNAIQLDIGRNKCPAGNKLCLKDVTHMPKKYTNFPQSLTKGMFGRDPMDRLVSAWKNKLYAMRLQFYYNKATRKILQAKNKDRTVPIGGKEAFAMGYRLTFGDFVEWIITGSNAHADEHWKPMYDLCNVCRVDFDFIGHLSHFNDDVVHFIDKLKVSRDILPESYEAVNAHSAAHNSYLEVKPTEEYFSVIPKAHKRQLLKIYKNDYDALSFPVPGWL